jgi:hypothetical protein
MKRGFEVLWAIGALGGSKKATAKDQEGPGKSPLLKSSMVDANGTL